MSIMFIDRGEFTRNDSYGDQLWNGLVPSRCIESDLDCSYILTALQSVLDTFEFQIHDSSIYRQARPWRTMDQDMRRCTRHLWCINCIAWSVSLDEDHESFID